MTQEDINDLRDKHPSPELAIQCPDKPCNADAKKEAINACA